MSNSGRSAAPPRIPSNSARQSRGAPRGPPPSIDIRETYAMSGAKNPRARAAVSGDRSGRPRLDKRAWQDIRRACHLRSEGEVHSVEVHGVRITFRKVPGNVPQESSGSLHKKNTPESMSER